MDLGAFPDDELPDDCIFENALLRGSKNATLIFQPGKYVFTNSLKIEDCKNISIKGNSTSFLLTHESTALQIINTSDVYIKDIAFLYKSPSSFSGRCVSTSNSSATIESRDADNLTNQIEALLGWDFILGRPAFPDLYFLKSPARICKMKKNIFSITGLPSSSRLQTDRTYIFRSKLYSSNIVLAKDSQNIFLEDISIFNSFGIGLSFKDCKNINILHLCSSPNIFSSYLSTSSDVLHFSNCRGLIFIYNSLFSSSGDDSINVHGTFGRLKKVINTSTIQYVTGRRDVDWPAPAAKVGDVVSIHHPTNPFGKPLVQGVVLSSQSGSEDKSLQITLDSPVSKDLPKDSVVWNQSTSPSLVVTKCRFLNNRARGILIQSSNARIEDNWFQGMTGPAIKVTCDVGRWWESGPSTNIIIRNNFISDCNDGPASSKGAITVDADAPGLRPVTGVHRNIEVTGNRIRDVGGMAISISSGSQVRVTQNRISTKDSPFIQVTNSTDVLVENNVSDDATSATILKLTKP